MDQFYCIIYLENNNQISLSLFFSLPTNKNIELYRYPICFTANSSKLLYILILYHSLFDLFSREHILYLGKEIYKAELALVLGQLYIQE